MSCWSSTTIWLPERAGSEQPSSICVWVTADRVYGVGDIEMALRRAGRGYVLGYVLGVNAHSQFHVWICKPAAAGTAEQIAQDLSPTAWRRVTAGEGTQGPRLHDWAYLELVDLEAND